LKKKDFEGTKLVLLMPGIGYHCDKPLLYHAGRLARQHGYTVVKVAYTGFKPGIKGNAKKMREAFDIAMEQTEEMLKGVKWEDYEDVVFISKSIGTVVSTYFQKYHGIKARNIVFTPLAETFPIANDAVVFHGTADQWVRDSSVIVEACERENLPLHLVEKTNHSLEGEDAMADVRNLVWIMEIVDGYLGK